MPKQALSSVHAARILDLGRRFRTQIPELKFECADACALTRHAESAVERRCAERLAALVELGRSFATEEKPAALLAVCWEYRARIIATWVWTLSLCRASARCRRSTGRRCRRS